MIPAGSTSARTTWSKRSLIRSSRPSSMTASSRRMVEETRVSSTTSKPLVEVGDSRDSCTAGTPRAALRLRDVGDEPARRAEHPGPDRLAAVAEVDGVDLHLVSTGVERGAGGELAQARGLRCGVGQVLGLVAAGVRVQPGEPHVEGDGVVEQGVVREDSGLLQDADPVLALQPRPLRLRQTDTRPRRRGRSACRPRSQPAARPAA